MNNYRFFTGRTYTMFTHSHRRRSARSPGPADGDGPLSDNLLFDQAPAAMLVVDLQDWRISRANRAASVLLGYSSDRFVGMRAGLLFTIDTPQLQRLLTGTDGSSHEVTVVREDGTTGLLWLSSTLVPGIDRQEALVALTPPLCDPGFQQQLDLADFQEFAEGLPQGIYEMNTRFVLTFLNRAALVMFGLTAEDFNRGICVVDFAVPEQRDEMIAVLSGSWDGIRTPRREWLVRRKDGSTFPVMIHATPIVQQGRVVGNRGLLIDISELKRSQEALEAANRKLNLLNAVTRHDIQNQVTVLLGYLVLAMDAVSDPGLTTLLSKGRAAAEAISRQIAFTSDYQEIGVRAPEWQHLGTVLAWARAGWEPEGVVITIGDADLQVYADPMLEKVFSNLIDNALRYGGPITRIRFSVTVTDAGCQIICADDGRGVRDDQKEMIFQKGVGHHTGFGLFLAREILQLTGITIAETGVYGEGAVFTISVPDGGYRHTVQGQ